MGLSAYDKQPLSLGRSGFHTLSTLVDVSREWKGN